MAWREKYEYANGLLNIVFVVIGYYFGSKREKDAGDDDDPAKMTCGNQTDPLPFPVMAITGTGAFLVYLLVMLPVMLSPSCSIYIKPVLQRFSLWLVPV
ncbi:MAG TPA: hypothetical protein VN176_05740 [Verrucomicrobiae bacterium]|nr:hypothetical protein [Verrucomicrobiae bacterium]